MPAKLRVFISSTMDDLANERAEVAAKLRSFNFEPVVAEEMYPTGESSWATIRAEIASCHLMVLVLGERYGWIPPEEEPAARRSVTEIEFDYARSLGMDVLPFIKRLDAAADRRDSAEAALRDAFRRRVQDWGGGIFRGTFDLARDLADKVGNAVVARLVAPYTSAHRYVPTPAPAGTPGPRTPLPPRLSADLVRSVAEGEAVLFVGAGISLAAGLPSAPAFAEHIVSLIRAEVPDYEPPGSGTYLNAVASDLMALRGRAVLGEAVAEVLRPLGVEPTAAHRAAVELFGRIVTTNYDLLLEQAAAGAAVPDGFEIVRLHGSIDDPATLVLTEADLISVIRDRPASWNRLIAELADRPLLALGTSLRDPSIVALLNSVGPSLRGWSVLPSISIADERRLADWSLQPVIADADGLFAALHDGLARYPG